MGTLKVLCDFLTRASWLGVRSHTCFERLRLAQLRLHVQSHVLKFAHRNSCLFQGRRRLRFSFFMSAFWVWIHEPVSCTWKPFGCLIYGAFLLPSWEPAHEHSSHCCLRLHLICSFCEDLIVFNVFLLCQCHMISFLIFMNFTLHGSVSWGKRWGSHPCKRRWLFFLELYLDFRLWCLIWLLLFYI